MPRPCKTVLFLADGMADEPLPELGGKTPLEAVDTPWMDRIAALGASGTFLSLPPGFPTSSDVANLSVLGYDLAACYPGRGPLEAAAQGIPLGEHDIAWRCNLVHAADGILHDYSAGHIANDAAAELMAALQAELGSAQASFHAGVSYRNLLILHSPEFCERVRFHKPDSSQGQRLDDLALAPADDSPEAAHTVAFLRDLEARAAAFLARQPRNAGAAAPANRIWPWSPGRQPRLQAFAEKYGRRGAVISAVDVIFGIARCAGMGVIKVPGATGFVDTNYEGKAAAAVRALADHDFVFLHVEAIDECGHMGDLPLKMQAIRDFDARIVGPVMQALDGQGCAFAVLPDHPVPVRLRKHTRTPVPVAICGPHIAPDPIRQYSETLAPGGALGHLRGDGVMRRLFAMDPPAQ